MGLFDSMRGGQGLVNTFQFNSGVGLPDLSPVYGAIQSRQKTTQAGQRSSTQSSETDRKWTPGQTRAYNENKLALDMHAQSLFSKWADVAEKDFGGNFGNLLTEKGNEIMMESLELNQLRSQLEEGNHARTKNAEYIYGLKNDRDFMNNIVLNDSGLAFGFNKEIGQITWGHVTDQDFMPLTGAQAMPFIEKEEAFLDTFLSLPTTYDHFKWENDIKEYVSAATSSMIDTGHVGENFSRSDASNMLALNQSIANAGSLINSSNRAGLLNEAIKKGPVKRQRYQFTERGLEHAEIAGEDGMTVIDPRTNPDEAIEQLMIDRAFTEAAVRLNIKTRTGVGVNPRKINKVEARHPWTDIATGLRQPDANVAVTLFTNNTLTPQQISQQLIKLSYSEERAQKIAAHMANFKNQNPNGTPQEFAVFVAQQEMYFREDGTLNTEASLRDFGTVGTSSQENNGRYTASELANKTNAESQTDKISRSQFTPRQIKRMMANDYIVNQFFLDSDMIHSAAMAFNHTIPGVREILFPGASTTNFRDIVGNYSRQPIIEFTGTALSNVPTNASGDSEPIPGIYADAVVYLPKSRANEIKVYRLKGRGREQQVRASRYYDFPTVNSQFILGAGSRYDPSSRKSLQEALTAEILRQGDSDPIVAVPMAVLLNHTHIITYDDYNVRKKENQAENVTIGIERQLMLSRINTARNIEVAFE